MNVDMEVNTRARNRSKTWALVPRKPTRGKKKRRKMKMTKKFPGRTTPRSSLTYQ